METVMVIADGFAWNGATFASLSAVAQAITGTKWNGHRFFGVRRKDRAAQQVEAVSDAAPPARGGGNPLAGRALSDGRLAMKRGMAASPGEEP